MSTEPTFTAFARDSQIAQGPVGPFISVLHRWTQEHGHEPYLAFEDATGRQVDFDLRGTLADALARVQVEPKGPGRPKLGVVSREISLLPRHWEWLETQQSGASATLRRLVDEARKRDSDRLAGRQAADASARFLTAMAGNCAGYEEASRALYGGHRETFLVHSATWPDDIRAYALKLAEAAWA